MIDVKATSTIYAVESIAADVTALTPGGTYTGSDVMSLIELEIEPAQSGAPNTYKWRKCTWTDDMTTGCSDASTPWVTDNQFVADVAAEVVDGVTVALAPGRVAGESWNFRIGAKTPLRLSNAAGD